MNIASNRAFAADLPRTLVAELQDEIAILQLFRAEKRNALDDETVLGLEGFFRALPESIRSVVIHGAGDHFSAGLDLNELTERSMAESVAHSRMWHRAFDRIEFGRVPVVVVMHGAVVGGGLELACAGHVRVAERSTYYGLPEGTRGIFVGGGGSVRIPRLIGTSRMMEMMLTGRTYGAEEGLTFGLSHYLVENGLGLERGIALARGIAGNTVFTNSAVMHALPRIADSGRTAGFFTESLIAALAQDEEEAKSRLRAFLEKRAPKVARD